MTTVTLPSAFDAAEQAVKQSALKVSQEYIDNTGNHITLEASMQGGKMQRLLTTTYHLSQSEGAVNQCPIDQDITFGESESMITIGYEDEEAFGDKRPSSITLRSPNLGLIKLALKWEDRHIECEEIPDLTTYDLTELSMTKNTNLMHIIQFGDVSIDWHENADAMSDALVNDTRLARQAVRDLLGALKKVSSAQEAEAEFAKLVKFQEPSKQRGAGVTSF